MTALENPTHNRCSNEKPMMSVGQYSSAGNAPINTDSYGVILPDMAMLEGKGLAAAIADGAWPTLAAKAASETIIKSFLNDYYATHASWSVETAGVRILTSLNRWLYAQGQRARPHAEPDETADHTPDHTVLAQTQQPVPADPDQDDQADLMVSSFAGLVLKACAAHVFHVGDCRIYRLRDTRLERLTQDHRARIGKDRDVLARALGLDPALDVAYHSTPAESGDTFIFTTHAVHSHLGDQEIGFLVKAMPDNLDSAARLIVDAARENGADGNLTCQIVRVSDPGRAVEQEEIRQLRQLPRLPDLVPGEHIDGMRIEAILHTGQCSRIYLARDTKTNEKRVIKAPAGEQADNPALLEQFRREEWIGRSINSPHVLKVLDYSHIRTARYYVTEYIEGQTLREWMAANPEPEPEEVQTIISQVAAGLRTFHRREMVHQNVRPENILIGLDNIARLIDFGSTAIAALDKDSGGEQPGFVKPDQQQPTPYRAPEYYLDHPPTARADMFALGVIAYEMLTAGHFPYSRAFKHARDVNRLKFTPATDYNHDLPVWIAGALAKAVARDPALRYDALSEFVADLIEPGTSLEQQEQAQTELNSRISLASWRLLFFGSGLLNLVLLLALIIQLVIT